MLERSVLMEEISLLERAAFHQTKCQLDLCEIQIYTEQRGDSVWVHRRLVELKPTSKLLISCAAANPNRISVYHQVLAEQTETGAILLNDSIITKVQLANESFANMNLRAIAKREVLLGNFIVYGSRIQCLQKAQFQLNNHLLNCEPLESFSLPDEYTVEYKGKKMEHHITTHQGQLLNDWLETYQTPLSNENFEVDVDTRAEFHPVVEAIFLDSVGEFSIAKISIFSAGTCLLLFLSFVVCFCCCRGCRECIFLVCSKSCTALYHIFTNKACRLRRDNDKLRRNNRQKRKKFWALMRTIIH